MAVAMSAMLAVESSTAATVVWSGVDVASNVSTNWSDANNWSGGTPGPANAIYFYDAGAAGAQGVVDNIVDGNPTILSL